MTIADDLPSLYAYTRWADGRIIATTRRLSAEQYAAEPAPGWASIRNTLVHMGGAMVLWAGVLGEGAANDRPTEETHPTLDDAERLLCQGHDAFDRLVSGLTAEHLATVWETTDPRGNFRRIPFWAVYRHVANHQTYHRGQVAAKLKRLGIDPPITDLVFWAIEQTPQERSGG